MDPEQFYYYTMGFFERSYELLTPEEQDTLRQRISLVRIPQTLKMPVDGLRLNRPCGQRDEEPPRMTQQEFDKMQAREVAKPPDFMKP